MALLAGRAIFNPQWTHRWTWYPPLFAMLLIAVAMVPFAPNPLIARDATQSLFLMWLLVVATASLIDSAPRAELLVKAYAAQFLIWGVLGASTGLVAWHTTLSNFDGFGAFMVIGGGLCGFLAFATHDKGEKWLMVLTVGLAAIGVVASFARGAALAAVLVAGVVWLRSPRKGHVLVVGIVCAVIIVATATILFGDKYWAELATIAQGTEEATGEDRWEMWKAGLQVFLQRPLLGTGSKNWGVFAAEFFKPGQLGGDFADNPGMLYDRSLHSSYVQILAEHGIAGLLAFGWIVRDFWRRNVQLRTAEAAERWRALGGRLRLKSLALGLEAAFIGWLASASLYSQNGSHWFYTILAMNLVVHRVATGEAMGGARSGGRGRTAVQSTSRGQGRVPATSSVMRSRI
ncbi:MAG: O-antigen ligase family protein, partial [Gemmatimonadota bacterium]